MFLYYTMIICIAVLSLLILTATARSNRMLTKTNKIGFVVTSYAIMAVAFAEWLCVLSEKLGYEYRLLNVIGTLIILIMTPMIPVFFANSIYKIKRIKFLYGILIFNAILQISSLYYGLIFSINNYNVYSRGPYYIIYIAIYTYCSCVAAYSVYRMSKKYQSKYSLVGLLILVLLLSTIAIQMVDSNVYVVWLGCAISVMLIYSFYCSLLTQVDSLTGLLNRRCFENRIQELNEDSIIAFFDVNDFKNINDIYGHLFGDKALIQIGNLIRSEYGKHGSCYRIGGDEFCVILIQKLDDIELLNSEFVEKVKKFTTSDDRIPSVSIGYAKFTKNQSNIEDVLDESDKMMYKVKQSRLK